MHHLPGKGTIAWLGFLLLNLHGIAAAQQGRHEFREVHLGMEARLVIGAATPSRAADAADAAFALIDSLELVLSDWRADSELRRLVGQPTGRWHPVSPALATVLEAALELARASGGAFDPTIGHLSALWREARRTGRDPDQGALALARARTGHALVVLDRRGQRIRFRQDSIRLDLGGIAKGYILDRVADTLTDLGITSMLLEFGGDLVLRSAPDAVPWRVAVPLETGDTILTLHNAAMGTSGGTFQWRIDAGGVVRSHVLDPTTGLGVAGQATVTVMAGSGMMADGLATTVALVDPEVAARLVRRFGATRLR